MRGVITVRSATVEDVPHLVALSESFRARLQTYQPTFWRKSAASAAAQTPYLEGLVRDASVIARVAEEQLGIAGFVVAVLRIAPAVYDPGGLSCEIDDFALADPTTARWQGIGGALLDAVLPEASSRGAVQVVVVCPQRDIAKRRMLRQRGLTVASEWYTAPLMQPAP